MISTHLLTALTALGSASASVVQSRAASVWQPKIGQRWQIILSSNLNTGARLSPANAPVWDLDLFNTDESTIDTLHSQGLKVICYFSAGTSEEGRPDLGGLSGSDYGKGLPDWPGEKYLNIRSDRVWQVMNKRITLAAQKGCDAVDPDNMDGYSNDNGIGLTQNDAAVFMKKMADAAHQKGLAIGLKNAEEILPNVINDIEFAVNEECTKTKKCDLYLPLLTAGKPVYHIEYGSANDLANWCLKSMPRGGEFDTVVKNLSLDGWVAYCDGSQYRTSTS